MKNTLTAWRAAAMVAIAGLAVRQHLHSPGFFSSRRAEKKRLEEVIPGVLAADANPVDVARAREPGRGRDAGSPVEIPLRGWRDIMLRVWNAIGEDRVLAVAGGVVFAELLAIFPAITAFVSLYALFANPQTIADHLIAASAIMPAEAYSVVHDEVMRVVTTGTGALSLASVISLVVAVFSANSGTKAIFDALNVAYREKEKRGFIRLNLLSLAFTFGAIIFLIIGIAGIVVLPLVFGFFGIQEFGTRLLDVLRWPVLFILTVAGLSVLYRWGPSRREARWRWITPGCAAAAILWLIGSGIFSWYLSNFANYGKTYGSLGAAVGLMMWMWVTFVIFLMGAEMDAEMEHQTARDTTTGGEKPLGKRGAFMADRIGKAQEPGAA